MKRIPNILIMVLSILLMEGASLKAQKDYFPGAEWRTSDAAAQGLNAKKLNTFIGQLKGGKIQRPISSILIVKNGYLVVNETFGNYKGTEAHTLQSVTKSITSTLLGVAMQKGLIKSLDEKVLSFFPEYKKIDNLNAHKQSMNLRDALTMRTGQTWTGERHLGALNRFSGDKMKYVLDYKMERSPGEKWYYNSGIAILLGGLLQNASGMDTRDFAQKHLFEPIGITSAQWMGVHRGIPHTGGGLLLNPADMARIGYLYLRNGKWEDRQILPEWWVKEATRRHVTKTNNIMGFPEIGYGYMWWLASLDRTSDPEQAEIYMAYGHWGQFIFVIPAYDMIVVFTNDNSATYYDEVRPISLFYEHILPTVSR